MEAPDIAEQDHPLPPVDSDAWDAGLAAAFQDVPDADSKPSVLARLGRMTGRDPRVLLRETGEWKMPPVRSPDDGERRTGRYRILGEIARGGVGVILKGRDADLGRDLAVKVLRDDHAGNAELVQRFVEEAQIGGQLEHPGIVPVYELGVDDQQRPYFTMKLIQGETLARELETRESPTADRVRFLQILERVCDAVAYAHARGVVHRDLKPANILVGSFGEVQVVDWGFAKVLPRGGVADEESAHVDVRDASLVATVRSGPTGMESQVGSVMGTPSYMPPEQALGRVDALDERTDVFALGAILCEILTGKPPYVGETLALTALKAQRADLAEAMARLDACAADGPLVELAKSCLQRNQGDRPRNAGRLAKAIAEYLESLQRVARDALVDAARATERADAERRTRRMQMVAGACVVVALGLLAGLFLWLKSNDRQRVSRIESGIHAALRSAMQRSGEGQYQLAAAALEKARALAAEPRIDPALAAQVEQMAKSTSAALRDARLIAALERVRSSDEVEASFLEDAYTAAFDDDGLDIDAVTPELLVARTGRGTPLARAVAFALDDWVWRLRPGRGERRRDADRLVELAQAVDDDPWRNALRTAAVDRDAVRLLELAAEADLDSLVPLSLDTLGLALRAARESDAAIGVLQRAVRAHPGDFYLNFHLAVLLEQHRPDDDDEAVTHARIALALQPASVGVRMFLGRHFAERGDLDRARRYLDEVEALDPDGTRARLLRAHLLQEEGDLRSALAVLDEIAASGRSRGPVHMARVALLIRMDEPERAREALRAALEGAPRGDASRRRERSSRGGRLMLDENGDGGVSPAETPPRLRPYFDVMDRDGDGSLDAQETRPLLRLLREIEEDSPQNPAPKTDRARDQG